MACALVESMDNLSLKTEETMETIEMEFKVSGLDSFCLDLEEGTTVRDMKNLATEHCNIEPEHMRFIHKGRELKQEDVLENDMEGPIQVLFTAGHAGLVGGGCQARSGSSTGVAGNVLRGMLESGKQSDVFSFPVRGLPGSKGLRHSRMSGRRGGMGLIRKYGILLKRQEFREKAEEIGFRKYR